MSVHPGASPSSSPAASDPYFSASPDPWIISEITSQAFGESQWRRWHVQVMPGFRYESVTAPPAFHRLMLRLLLGISWTRQRPPTPGGRRRIQWKRGDEGGRAWEAIR